MQTTDVKVPVTRVTKVSEMRTLHDIPDNAVLMVAYDGRGYKTSFKQLKELVVKELHDEFMQALDKKFEDLHKETTENSSGIATVVSQLEESNAENANKFADTSNKIKTFKQECNKADNALKQQIEKLSQTEAGMQTSIVQLFQKSDTIEKNMTSSNALATQQLETVKNDFASQLSSAKTNAKNELLAAKKQLLQDVDSKMKTLQNVINNNISTALEKQSSQTTSEIEDLQKKIEQLSDVVKQLLDDKDKTDDDMLEQEAE